MSKKHEIQLQHWKSLIEDHVKSGMKVLDWCEANGVTKHAYYYWRAKLREEHYEEAAQSLSKEAAPTNTFVELPVPKQPCQIQPTRKNSPGQPAAILQKDGLRIEIFQDIPSLLLQQLLKVVSDV